jgi:HK97 family phage portal protein
MPDYHVVDRRHSAVGPSERRDPVAATTNTVFVSPGRPGITWWNAEQAIKFGYMSQIYVYRCAQKIATDIASLPFRVGADPDKPGDYDTKSPMAQHLGPMPGHPNPELTARVMLTHSIAMYLVTGRWAWEIDRGGDGSRRAGEPVAIWPLAVHQLEPNPTNSGNQYFDGFTYFVQGQQKTLRNDQIVYAWKPSLLDPRQPESVLQAARLNVDVASMLDQYSAAFLRNNATPATAVVTEAWATPEDRDAFQAQFNGSYGGVKNAGRTAFLEANGDGEKGVTGMFDIKPIGLSQKDAQFNDQLRAQISSICVAFGVPLSKLGDASGRTFSNADQEDENYWTDLLPTIRDMQDHINLRLAPQYGGGKVGWFDLSGVKALKPHRNLLPITVSEARDKDIITLGESREYIGVSADNEELAAAANAKQDQVRAQYANVGLPALVAAEIISAEEGRQLLGLTGPPPTPAPVPVPVQPVIGAPAVPPALPSGTTPPGVDANNQADPNAPARADVPVSPAPAHFIDHDARVAFLRTSYERNARRLLDKQADSVHRWLSGKRGIQLVSRGEVDNVTIYDQEFWSAETKVWASDMYRTAVDFAAIEQGTTWQGAEDYIEARAGRMAAAVTAELAEVVRSAYVAAVTDYGRDHTEVVGCVDDAVRQYIDAAAPVLAERESERAYDDVRVENTHADHERLTAVLGQLAQGSIDTDAALAALQEGAPHA